MYINFSVLAARGYSIHELILLQMIKQNKSEDMSEYIRTQESLEDLENFKERGFIEYVKPKKKEDDVLTLIRTTKKANQLLEDIYCPEVDANDIKMADYLCDMYVKMTDDPERRIGNKKLVRIYCSIFRKQMGLDIYQMYWLCYYFLQNFTYTKVLEYIFYNKKDNPYGKFKDNIEYSKLWQYYNENTEEIEKFWKLKIQE